MKKLSTKSLLSDEVGIEASIISKDKTLRKIVHNLQLNLHIIHLKNTKVRALMVDITYKIVPDADFKFYITANLKTRALRRFWN